MVELRNVDDRVFDSELIGRDDFETENPLTHITALTVNQMMALVSFMIIQSILIEFCY